VCVYLIGGAGCGSLRRVPGESLPDDVAGLRAANARLRELLAERDAEAAGLRAGLEAEREARRRLELRLAELERRLSMDSSDSGTPSSSGERIGAKEARRARQQSERERRKDRKRGGQPGHQGKGLERDPDPDQMKDAEPPAECRSCRASRTATARLAREGSIASRAIAQPLRLFALARCR
jgi:transposase